MAKLTYEIKGILAGMSQYYYHTPELGYKWGLGIDPDANKNLSVGTFLQAAGAITPVPYTKFSGTEVTGYPNWIITQPKTENSFVYASDGKLHSFNNVLVMRTADEAPTALPISLTNGNGSGGAYYNNFLYLMLSDDVSQYGPLDGGSAVVLTADVWTGAKFSATALVNTTYPNIRGRNIPNHPAHYHIDDSLYFGDVLPSSGSTSLRGVIHKIKTQKASVDGDNNNGSQYNVLDLPYGCLPTDIESYGNDLAIAAIQTTSDEINQGKPYLFLWDTISPSFYRQVPLPDSLVTALYNKNGQLFVFTGNSVNGARVSEYLGGNTLNTIRYFEEGTAPFAGAVDAYGDKLVFGGYTTTPVTSASVFAVGSVHPQEGVGLHNIAKSTSSGSNQSVSSVKFVQQHQTGVTPRMVIGWGDSDSKGLDKFSPAATETSYWQSEIFNVGRKFQITKIRIPLGTAVDDSGIAITPKIWVDDESASYTLATINTTNFANSEKNIVYRSPSMATSSSSGELNPSGEHNFMLEFAFTGTAARSILFPITIEVETIDD